MGKKKNKKQKSQDTGIFIDFTGNELVLIASACIARDCTFNEFINDAIQHAAEEALKPVDDYTYAGLERNTLENVDVTLWTHKKDVCDGQYCTIHNRSNHAMRSWPQNWRTDRKIMERVCSHGVGHTDPDDYALFRGWDDGVHACDGCCAWRYEV